MTANAAFYPTMMWDGRFSAASGNPFDDTGGFIFPAPEDAMFPEDGNVTHLLAAQAFLPVTEFVEMAGFNGTAGDGDLDAEFAQFDEEDDFVAGNEVPDADTSGYRHDPIRQAVLDRLNSYDDYVTRFTNLFGTLPADGIEDWMVAAALAEFQFNQVAAEAPLDRYVSENNNGLLTPAQKQGALIFFGKGQCVSCHAVAGESNEMFSDFKNHVVAVPQVAPEFGVDTDGAGLGNVIFDGTDRDEDYGLERTTGLDTDRYKFRTAPLRNLARSPAYFHNGSFTDLGEAIRYHLTAIDSAANYVPPSDLADDLVLLGPYDDMLLRIDDLLNPQVTAQPSLTETEINQQSRSSRRPSDSKSAPGKQCAAKPRQVLSHTTMGHSRGARPGTATDRSRLGANRGAL
jgi:cytochrome c peroxidase